MNPQGRLESIAAGSNTGVALVAMSKWAAHRRLLPSPGGAGGPGGKSVSPLFDSAALPTVFERLLLLATATTTPTGAGNGPLCLSNGNQQEGERAPETGGGRDGDGSGGGEEVLEEATAGLDDLLRWALPSLVGVV